MALPPLPTLCCPACPAAPEPPLPASALESVEASSRTGESIASRAMEAPPPLPAGVPFVFHPCLKRTCPRLPAVFMELGEYRLARDQSQAMSGDQRKCATAC